MTIPKNPVSNAIADYLQAKGLGKVGKTIFEYEMPATCEKGILVLDNYYGVQMNHYLPGYYTTEYRTVVRAKDLGEAQALAGRLVTALTIRSESTEMPGLLVKQSLPTNLPRVYPRSAGSYWELEVDVDFKFAVL